MGDLQQALSFTLKLYDTVGREMPITFYQKREEHNMKGTDMSLNLSYSTIVQYGTVCTPLPQGHVIAPTKQFGSTHSLTTIRKSVLVFLTRVC
jgi:hypothetical protein